MRRAAVNLAAPMTCILLAVACVGVSEAASVKLRYGFQTGSVYRVTEQYHDVGKSVTEMNVMGQQQTMETPTDQVSSGTWKAKVVGKVAGGVKLAVEYGQYKGGERWASNKMETGDIFGSSSAEVVVHPVDGAVKVVASPAGDQTVEIIYQGRFAWMPELPEGPVGVGSEFTHEYVLQSGMYNIKATDEYYLAGIKGGFATFDVETRQLMVIRMDQGAGGGGAIPGMAMADMKLAYKGEGTAVFDLKEGIFVEREGRMSYSNLDSGQTNTMGMAFSTRMTGVARYKWEMERQ
ncbi:MAG: hypothetical protein P1S46_02105 [bacterium]|nr:hypothetical protein [bacterium]MDT8395544.1 hypothetical protein [bacterium]